MEQQSKVLLLQIENSYLLINQDKPGCTGGWTQDVLHVWQMSWPLHYGATVRARMTRSWKVIVRRGDCKLLMLWISRDCVLFQRWLKIIPCASLLCSESDNGIGSNGAWTQDLLHVKQTWWPLHDGTLLLAFLLSRTTHTQWWIFKYANNCLLTHPADSRHQHLNWVVFLQTLCFGQRLSLL